MSLNTNFPLANMSKICMTSRSFLSLVIDCQEALHKKTNMKMCWDAKRLKAHKSHFCRRLAWKLTKCLCCPLKTMKSRAFSIIYYHTHWHSWARVLLFSLSQGALSVLARRYNPNNLSTFQTSSNLNGLLSQDERIHKRLTWYMYVVKKANEKERL